MQRRRIIKVKDKSFTVTISERAIKRQIKRIADQINRDYEGKRPVFLARFPSSSWHPMKALIRQAAFVR